MKRSEIVAQYDRFITQVREEIKALYWLYNFFFLIESALVGAVFLDKLSDYYLLFAKITGLLSSIYWFWVNRKQKLWRDHWLIRIADIETELRYKKIRMWPKDPSSFFYFLFRKNGLWRALFILPIGFAVTWVLLLILE